MLTMRALKNAKIGNEIIVARDGAEALEFLLGGGPPGHDGQPFSPLLILLDLKLPKIDGLTVLERIRNDERTKHLPVVALTSSDEQEDIVRSYRGGVNSYVRKPVDFSEFIDSVGKVGVYWLLINEPPPAGG
jgi:two-component system response regulator